MKVAHKLIAHPSASIAASRMLAASNESIRVFQIVISWSKFVVVCTQLGSRSVFRCAAVILNAVRQVRFRSASLVTWQQIPGVHRIPESHTPNNGRYPLERTFPLVFL